MWGEDVVDHQQNNQQQEGMDVEKIIRRPQKVNGPTSWLQQCQKKVSGLLVALEKFLC